ncbi:hypothetical protein LXL04_025876 [Taraxacum kok-saghyz]
MEAIKKQASKLREQVAKQQQAVLSRLGKDAEIYDAEELNCHQKLQDLYKSTTATKHFQKEIVRGVEGFISISRKQKQIAKRLAEDCHKFGTDNTTARFPLAKVALELGGSQISIEEKSDNMLEIFHNQVCEPLRGSIRGAPLEDARHLARSCEKLRQEVETQAVEVLRRQTKYRDPTTESVLKLKNMEKKLSEVRASMVTLEKEAISAMLSVEEHQQQITLQKLVMMVDAERDYHRHVVGILEELHAEMILALHMQESTKSVTEKDTSGGVTRYEHKSENQNNEYFIGKVIHPFDAQADGELSLSIDDFVIVRQVSPSGWSEGECNGKTGWFPSAYLERQENTKTSPKSYPAWSQQETRDFIAIRGELERDFTLAKWNKSLWEVVALKMKEIGYTRTPDQCKCRWKNLINRYKGKETSDRDNTRSFPFFDDLHALFTPQTPFESKKRVTRIDSYQSLQEIFEDDDDENEDEDDENKITIPPRKKPEREKRSRPPTPKSSDPIREILHDFFQQQKMIDMQWRQLMEKHAYERQLFEQEWRQSMERLEIERLKMDKLWREKEEQRRMREEVLRRWAGYHLGLGPKRGQNR